MPLAVNQAFVLNSFWSIVVIIASNLLIKTSLHVNCYNGAYCLVGCEVKI